MVLRGRENASLLQRPIPHPLAIAYTVPVRLPAPVYAAQAGRQVQETLRRVQAVRMDFSTMGMGSVEPAP